MQRVKYLILTLVSVLTIGISSMSVSASEYSSHKAFRNVLRNVLFNAGMYEESDFSSVTTEEYAQQIKEILDDRSEELGLTDLVGTRLINYINNYVSGITGGIANYFNLPIDLYDDLNLVTGGVYDGRIELIDAIPPDSDLREWTSPDLYAVAQSLGFQFDYYPATWEYLLEAFNTYEGNNYVIKYYPSDNIPRLIFYGGIVSYNLNNNSVNFTAGSNGCKFLRINLANNDQYPESYRPNASDSYPSYTSIITIQDLSLPSAQNGVIKSFDSILQNKIDNNFSQAGKSSNFINGRISQDSVSLNILSDDEIDSLTQKILDNDMSYDEASSYQGTIPYNTDSQTSFSGLSGSEVPLVISNFNMRFQSDYITDDLFDNLDNFEFYSPPQEFLSVAGWIASQMTTVFDLLPFNHIFYVLVTLVVLTFILGLVRVSKSLYETSQIKDSKNSYNKGGRK